MHRELVSEKGQMCNKISTPGGGGRLMFQTNMKSFKDCKQTTVRNILKF